MPARVSQDDPSQSQAPFDTSVFPLSDPGFDSVDFLNETLPVLTLSAQLSTQKTSRTPQIQTAASDVQTLLSKLNTLNIRSSSELTTLTDEILRSGNRLAYEVEILRGEVNSLHDLLTDTLRDDIRQFVLDEAVRGDLNGTDGEHVAEDTNKPNVKSDPEFMTQLRMLGTVKTRLESVVTVFGEAMKWPLPPSDLSMANSLISVSAPEFGMQNTDDDEKAREIARLFRGEVADLLDSDGGGYAGLDAAIRKIDSFRQLASIWKGTVEEKARTRFVDGLAKIVDDRKRALDARSVSQGHAGDITHRSSSTPGRTSKADGPASGLFRNLARLKDDLYLE